MTTKHNFKHVSKVCFLFDFQEFGPEDDASRRVSAVQQWWSAILLWILGLDTTAPKLTWLCWGDLAHNV